MKFTIAPPAATVVGIADGTGVAVGVILTVGLAGVGVGDGGGPLATVIDVRAKPGEGDGDAPDPPLLVQLSVSAASTNNTTGETTSHLSHHEIDIEASAITVKVRGVKLSCDARGNFDEQICVRLESIAPNEFAFRCDARAESKQEKGSGQKNGGQMKRGGTLQCPPVRSGRPRTLRAESGWREEHPTGGCQSRLHPTSETIQFRDYSNSKEFDCAGRWPD
ncbi:MAG TPA: hypothetical protein VEU51_12110 [Candidatus Acidoferrales bacterium]|nr:hypothetical protein [Candidatus Acidoferrales bacterium]